MQPLHPALVGYKSHGGQPTRPNDEESDAIRTTQPELRLIPALWFWRMTDPLGAIEFGINRIKEIAWYVKAVREYSSDVEDAGRICSELSDTLDLAKKILEDDRDAAEPIFAHKIEDLGKQNSCLEQLVQGLKPSSNSNTSLPRKSWHKWLPSKLSSRQQLGKEWKKYTHPLVSRPQLQKVTSVCQSYKTRLLELVQLYNTRLSQRVNQNTNALVSENQRRQDESLRKWYRSQSPLNFRDEAQRNVEEVRCTPGTGEWLLTNDTLILWRDQTAASDTLVCHGLGGAGKTILASVLVKHLQDSKFDSSAVCCIFCNHQQPGDTLVEYVLSAFLSQLIDQASQIPSQAMLLKEKHSRAGTSLTQKEVQQLIEELVLHHFPAVYLIVDALDECDNSAPHRAKDRLLAFMARLRACSTFSLLVTSRDSQDVKALNAEAIQIKAPDDDIFLFLESRRGNLPAAFRDNDALCSHIFAQILTVSDCMFKVAQLLIDLISEADSKKEVIKLLDDMPRGELAYHPLYRDTVMRIEKQGAAKIRRVKLAIFWTMHGPLFEDQLQHALAIDETDGFSFSNIPDVSDVVRACKGLLEFDSVQKRVRLSHKTVGEFFVSTSSPWNDERKKIWLDSLLMYLSTPAMVRCTHRSPDPQHVYFKYPLKKFCCEYLQKTFFGSNIIPGLEPLLPKLLANDDFRFNVAHDMAFALGGYSAEAAASVTASHLCAGWGLIQFVARYKDDINSRTIVGHTPLVWAASTRLGWQCLTKLLKCGAQTGITAAGSFKSPLQVAAQHRHDLAMTTLLKHHSKGPSGLEDADEALKHLLWDSIRNSFTGDTTAALEVDDCVKSLLRWTVDRQLSGDSYVVAYRDYWLSQRGQYEDEGDLIMSGSPPHKHPRRLHVDPLGVTPRLGEKYTKRLTVPYEFPKHSTAHRMWKHRPHSMMGFERDAVVKEAFREEARFLAFSHFRPYTSDFRSPFSSASRANRQRRHLFRSRSASGSDLDSIIAKARFRNNVSES